MVFAVVGNHLTRVTWVDRSRTTTREAVILGIVQKITFLPYIEKPTKPSK